MMNTGPVSHQFGRFLKRKMGHRLQTLRNNALWFAQGIFTSAIARLRRNNRETALRLSKFPFTNKPKNAPRIKHRGAFLIPHPHLPTAVPNAQRLREHLTSGRTPQRALPVPAPRIR